MDKVHYKKVIKLKDKYLGSFFLLDHFKTLLSPLT